VRVVTGEVPTPAPTAPDPAALARDPERYGKEADRKEVEKILARIDAPPPPPSFDRAGRTVTGVVTFADCPRRFRLTRLFPLSPPSGAEGARSVSLGSRFHRFMELFWRGREREAAALARGAPDLPRWRDRFLALPEARPFLAADLREPELSFCVPAQGRPLRGAVDLLARTAGGVGGDRLQDRPRPGRRDPRAIPPPPSSLYRLALRVLTGRNAPVEAWIYAAREGRFLPVPAEEEEARAALGRYDRAEEEGAYGPCRSVLCGTCLYRRGCAAVGGGEEG